jgi:hypothetical protein
MGKVATRSSRGDISSHEVGRTWGPGAEGHVGAGRPKGKREISPMRAEMNLMAMAGTSIGSNLRVWKKKSRKSPGTEHVQFFEIPIMDGGKKEVRTEPRRHDPKIMELA